MGDISTMWGHFDSELERSLRITGGALIHPIDNLDSIKAKILVFPALGSII